MHPFSRHNVFLDCQKLGLSLRSSFLQHHHLSLPKYLPKLSVWKCPRPVLLTLQLCLFCMHFWSRIWMYWLQSCWQSVTFWIFLQLHVWISSKFKRKHSLPCMFSTAGGLRNMHDIRGFCLFLMQHRIRLDWFGVPQLRNCELSNSGLQWSLHMLSLRTRLHLVRRILRVMFTLKLFDSGMGFRRLCMHTVWSWLYVRWFKWMCTVHKLHGQLFAVLFTDHLHRMLQCKSVLHKFNL